MEVPHEEHYEEHRDDYDHYKQVYEDTTRGTRPVASSFEGSVGSSSGGDTVVFRPKTHDEKGSAGAILVSWEPDSHQRTVEYEGDDQRSAEISIGGAEEEDVDHEVAIHLSDEEEEEALEEH